MRWEPNRSAATLSTTPPDTAWTALGRGARNHCPVCDKGKVFQGYLKVVPECAHCGAPLGTLRADDAPPYFTILVVGHLLLPPVLMIEKAWMPPMWLHMVVWLPLFTIACIGLLRPIKGATVGLLSRFGFEVDDHGPDPITAPGPAPSPAPPPSPRGRDA